MSGEKSVEFKVPTGTEDQIPTGWNLKTDVQKDGTKLQVYYCPDTRQHFYTYADLIRYVDYAKSEGIGVYSKCFKKRETHTEIKKPTPKPRKTSAILSLPRRPSNSLTVVDRSSDSKSSTPSESSDKEKDEGYVAISSDEEKDEDDVAVSSDDEEDEDYVPEPDGDATVYLEVDGGPEAIQYLISSKKPRTHNPARC